MFLLWDTGQYNPLPRKREKEVLEGEEGDAGCFWLSLHTGIRQAVVFLSVFPRAFWTRAWINWATCRG